MDGLKRWRSRRRGRGALRGVPGAALVAGGLAGAALLLAFLFQLALRRQPFVTESPWAFTPARAPRHHLSSPPVGRR
jgi:hypothetical protein